MPNVEILDNVFVSNSDLIEFNSDIVSHWIENGYYLKEYFDIGATEPCNSILHIYLCINVKISDLTIDSNSLRYANSSGLALVDMDGEFSSSNVIISNNTCDS